VAAPAGLTGQRRLGAGCACGVSKLERKEAMNRSKRTPVTTTTGAETADLTRQNGLHTLLDFNSIPAGTCDTVVSHWRVRRFRTRTTCSSNPPKHLASGLVNSLKGVSSRLLRVERPDLEKRYWNHVLWSPSYFAASCGGALLGIIKQYGEPEKTPSNGRPGESAWPFAFGRPRTIRTKPERSS
jgi:hypothetical protein